MLRSGFGSADGVSSAIVLCHCMSLIAFICSIVSESRPTLPDDTIIFVSFYFGIIFAIMYLILLQMYSLAHTPT